MNGPKSPAVQRFEFFTDGVLAIIVTIMAIELKIPASGTIAKGNLDFGILAPELPKLMSYALGFFMVATGWVSHLLMSRTLQRTSIQLRRQPGFSDPDEPATGGHGVCRR